MFCSTSSMVTPCASARRACGRSAATMSGARPSEGSSRSSSRGRAISARPSASICCSPPESVPACWCMRSRGSGRGVDALAVLLDAGPLDPRGGAEAQVLRHGERAEDAAALRAMGDAEPHDARRRQPVDPLAVEADRAGARPDQPGNGAQHRALAGAVGAEQRHHLARGDVEADALDRGDRAVVHAELLDRENRERSRPPDRAVARAQAWPR